MVAWVAERMTLADPWKYPWIQEKLGLGGKIDYSIEKRRVNKTRLVSNKLRDRCIILYTMTHHFCTLTSHAKYALTPAVTWSFHLDTQPQTNSTPSPSRRVRGINTHVSEYTLNFYYTLTRLPYSFCTASTKIETTLLSTIVTAFYIPYCLGISIPYIHSLCVHTFTQINQSIQASNSIL